MQRRRDVWARAGCGGPAVSYLLAASLLRVARRWVWSEPCCPRPLLPPLRRRLHQGNPSSHGPDYPRGAWAPARHSGLKVAMGAAVKFFPCDEVRVQSRSEVRWPCERVFVGPLASWCYGAGEHKPFRLLRVTERGLRRNMGMWSRPAFCLELVATAGSHPAALWSQGWSRKELAMLFDVCSCPMFVLSQNLSWISGSLSQGRGPGGLRKQSAEASGLKQ